MLAMLGGLKDYRPSGVDPSTSAVVPVLEGSWLAFQLTLQWVFAYAALGSVVGVDWGAGSISEKDVRIGGWLGVGLAPAIVATLALIAIAGHRGSVEARDATDPSPRARSTIQELPGAPTATEAPANTFRAVLAGGFDPRVSCVMLLVFGLASLAPACYAAFVFGEQFKAIGPGLPRFAWSMMGTATAWFLIVGGWSDRPEAIFGLMGAAFSPVAGCLLADFRRHQGRPPVPRTGLNPAGMLAWAVGLAVGLAPILARAPRLRPPRLLPARRPRGLRGSLSDV